MIRVDHFDMSGVDVAIAGVLRKGTNLGKAMRQVRVEMKIDQRDHAQAASGPESKWPPRAAATIAKLKANGKRARRPLGKLLTAVEYFASNAGVTAKSRISWSGTHAEGDTVGHGAKVPARQWLWISEWLVRRAIQIFGRHLLDGWA